MLVLGSTVVLFSGFYDEYIFQYNSIYLKLKERMFKTLQNSEY